MRLITVFADASHWQDAGGYAFWARDDGDGRVQGSAPWPCDGIAEAETVGLASGFFAAVDNLPHAYGTAIILQSDSLQALGAFYQACAGKPAKSTDRPIVPHNSRNAVILSTAMEVRRVAHDLGLKVWLKHIKGHTGYDSDRHRVNAWCDAEAKSARRLCAARIAEGAYLPQNYLPPQESVLLSFAGA